MLKVGVVGLGAIGQAICRAIDDGKIAVQLVAVTELDLKKASAFTGTLRRPPDVVSLDELVERSDLVVEAASQEALQQVAPKTLEKGKDLLVLSVGGLLGREEWFRLAGEKSCRLHVPSGALAGLDGVKAACEGEVRSVTLVTRKPPQALAQAPYVLEHKLDLGSLQQETVLFEGSAREACAAFPANVNVAAALSLAGIGLERTRVKIVAVPGSQRNVHDVEVEGEFGLLRVHVESDPSELNPRTSKLAPLSAIATLRRIVSQTKVGT